MWLLNCACLLNRKISANICWVTVHLLGLMGAIVSDHLAFNELSAHAVLR